MLCGGMGQAGRKQHPSARALELLEQDWSGSLRHPHMAHCAWSVAPMGSTEVEGVGQHSVCLHLSGTGGSPAPSSPYPHSFFLSSVLFHGPSLESSRTNTGRQDAPSMLSTSPTPLLSAGALIHSKCHICSGPHVKANNALKDMQRSRRVT